MFLETDKRVDGNRSIIIELFMKEIKLLGFDQINFILMDKDLREVTAM